MPHTLQDGIPLFITRLFNGILTSYKERDFVPHFHSALASKASLWNANQSSCPMATVFTSASGTQRLLWDHHHLSTRAQQQHCHSILTQHTGTPKWVLPPAFCIAFINKFPKFSPNQGTSSSFPKPVRILFRSYLTLLHRRIPREKRILIHVMRF